MLVRESVLGGVERRLEFRRPFDGGILLLPLSFQRVGERCANAGDVGDETMIIVYHSEETLDGFDVGRRRKVADGADFFLQRRDAVSVDPVAEEVDGIDAEDALCFLDDESVFVEALEESSEVVLVIGDRFAGYEDVVHVDEDVPQALGDSIHEPLERLCGAAQPEWHAQEFPQAEGSDDGSLRNVTFRHGNLVISPHQVHLGENFLPREVRCEVLNSRQRVGVVRCDAVEAAVVAARAPPAAGVRCDVKRRRPRALGSADDAEFFHVGVLLASDEELLRREWANFASKWRAGSFDETLDVVFGRVVKRFRFSQVRVLVEDAFVRTGDFGDGDAARTDGGVVVVSSGVGADSFERFDVDEALVTQIHHYSVVCEEIGADDAESDGRDHKAPREASRAETNRFKALAECGDLGPAGGDERRSGCSVTPVVVRDDLERDVGAGIDQKTFGAVAVVYPESAFAERSCAGGRYLPPASAFPGRRWQAGFDGGAILHGAMQFLALAPNLAWKRL